MLEIDHGQEILTFIEGEVAVDPHWQPGRGQRLPTYARTVAQGDRVLGAHKATSVTVTCLDGPLSKTVS